MDPQRWKVVAIDALHRLAVLARGAAALPHRFRAILNSLKDESSATIGVDFKVCKLEVKGRRVKLSIWVCA